MDMNPDAMMKNESLDSQIDRLATFIMKEIPGEPSRNEGAVDCAIRIIGEQQARVHNLEYEIEKLGLI